MRTIWLRGWQTRADLLTLAHASHDTATLIDSKPDREQTSPNRGRSQVLVQGRRRIPRDTWPRETRYPRFSSQVRKSNHLYNLKFDQIQDIVSDIVVKKPSDSRMDVFFACGNGCPFIEVQPVTPTNQTYGKGSTSSSSHQPRSTVVAWKGRCCQPKSTAFSKGKIESVLALCRRTFHDHHPQPDLTFIFRNRKHLPEKSFQTLSNTIFLHFLATNGIKHGHDETACTCGILQGRVMCRQINPDFSAVN